MRLTDRTRQLTASPIAEAKHWLTQRTSTRPLLDLSQAAPSYPTAPVIVDRIAEVAASPDAGAYAPPPGLPVLREAFAAELETDYGGTVLPTHVLPTAGCNQAFCIVASALCEPGDEVILIVPYYFNHFMWLELDGVTPVFVRSTDEIEGAITERTRAVLLVTPGNPTGETIAPAEIARIADLARSHDLALMIDETYRTFRETDDAPHSLFTRSDWPDHVISLHSFSKDFAIPGYRVGAVVGGEAILYEAAKLLDCVAICAPRIGQEAVIAGLLHAGDWRRAQIARIHASLDHFRTVMAEKPGGYELASSGAFFGWVRHPFEGRDTSDVVRELVLERDVLVIPGTAFTPTDEGWLRFSFANLSIEEIDQLADRLA